MQFDINLPASTIRATTGLVISWSFVVDFAWLEWIAFSRNICTFNVNWKIRFQRLRWYLKYYSNTHLFSIYLESNLTCFFPWSLINSVFSSKMFGTLIPSAVASAKKVSTVILDEDINARLSILSSYARLTTAWFQVVQKW